MDAKVTLSFQTSVIENAKVLASSKGLSLSRLTEILLRKAIESSKTFDSIENYPVSDWVMEVSEGAVEYQTKRKSSRKLKEEFYNAKG
jgi:chromosome segregation and condensation protein ScpB